MKELTFEKPLPSIQTPSVGSPVEMAYVLLDQCIRGFCIRIGDTASVVPPLNRWLPVNTLTSPKGAAGSTSASHDVCHRCHLVLNVLNSGDSMDESGFALSLDWNHVHPFDGNVRDVASKNLPTKTTTGITPNRDYRCNCRVNPGTCRRSDAALLAGLLVACAAHVQVVDCRVLLLSQDEGTDMYTGSILCTLAFPYLFSAPPSSKINCKRSIVPRSTVKRSTSNSPVMPLNSALRLLLSLIRSDWGQLEPLQQQLMHVPEPVATRKDVPFFPSLLTLGDIYNSIQGSTSHTNRLLKASPSNAAPSPLSSLPLDILQERLAPFLNAREVAAVRSTSMHLYWSLRSVVPGLKLRLYTHQVNSLFWMRQREASLIKTEADCFQTKDDKHRDVTGGISVRLASNPATTESELCVILDPWTGLEIFRDEALSEIEKLPRRVACGGLLCDDPGLGKTITVLALILQTYQPRTGPPKQRMPKSYHDQSDDEDHHWDADSCLSTESARESRDDKLFHTYWEEQVEVDFRRPALLKLINDFCKRIPNSGCFPLPQIQKDIGADVYGCDFSAFQSSVENAIKESYGHEPFADSPFSTFRMLVLSFKKREVYSIRKTFSNESYKPNSRVAAVISEQNEKRILHRMIPSPGTLLVVPSVLIEHWKTQIQLHVDLQYCTDKIPLIFEYRRNDAPMPVNEAIDLCHRQKTHAPIVFIDNSGSRPLPSAEFLSMFQIVITTTHRFMNEAKRGSFQTELELRDSIEDNPYSGFLQEDDKCSVLLKIHWLRLVVDEGHSMGHDKTNSTIQFAAWVRSHRRWAMTGTPTKHNAAQLGQLRGLFRFLQHDFFSARLGGDAVWKKHIAKCWRDGDISSFFRIRSLLCFLMRRHTKYHIVELPSPTFSKSEISMSCLEANTYNTLVSAVQMNLLLTSMKGKTSGLQDSLLHRSQAKNARLAIQNIRRVCTGWSRVIPTISNRFFLEALDMARSLNLSETSIAEIESFMTRAGREELSSCSCCGIRVSTMLLMSCCGGQICTECMDSSTSTCYLCDNSFDVDELQKFQPGFVLEWRSNLELENSPGGNAVSNRFAANDRELAIRPPLNRRRLKKFGDGHDCEYDRFSADGRCIHCLEEHVFCCLMNSRARCEICHRIAEECPKDESKSYYLSRRLIELVEQKRNMPVDFSNELLFQDSMRPLKVIVYSQFRAALNFMGDRLLRKFGTACIAEYFGSHRKKELQKFTTEPICFCLLLTKDGSEGLDLSFVTNIIFLEEVFDKSLEEQVVARAWRMGAKGKVSVETLIAKNSMEQFLGNHVSDGFDQGEDDDTAGYPSSEKQRLKALLLSLRFITDHHNFSSSILSTSADDVNVTGTGGENVGCLKRQLTPPVRGDNTLSESAKRQRTVRFVQ